MVIILLSVLIIFSPTAIFYLLKFCFSFALPLINLFSIYMRRESTEQYCGRNSWLQISRLFYGVALKPIEMTEENCYKSLGSFFILSVQKESRFVI
jgi:hypothetical protein